MASKPHFPSMVGSTPQMKEIFHMVEAFASKRHPVLITGESGTGKELVARAIHDSGPWRQEPFVPVDCGALSPTLIESELFGHVQGAFTGAVRSREGLFAAAGSGTAFLDEIGELPIGLQGKLLRALQNREVRRIGSNIPVQFEARIIAASNRDLKATVSAGTFRKDLFYRLNVFALNVPPLRERKADIPALAQYFVDLHGGPEKGVTGISKGAVEKLTAFDWPGNVRELENAVLYALAFSRGPEIGVKDLPGHILRQRCPVWWDHDVLHLDDWERQAIVQALVTSGGHRSRAARILGIGKTTVYRKIKEYGLEKDFPARPPGNSHPPE